MGATVKQYGKENIAIVTYTPPFEPGKDLTAVQKELEKILSSIKERLQVIVDLRQIKLTFSELVESLGTSTSRTSEASSRSGRMDMMFVGSDKMIEMAANAYKQEQYGGIEVKMFHSIDEAIEFARNQS